MTTVNVEDFSVEKECQYDGERYFVRDNGSVLRHARLSKRVRAADGQWTFGVANSTNPYLHIASVRVHRIVATAFHGEPPDPKYVVDHIDSNCRNNRPENLRWLTRLENTLLNPTTRKKIEYLCGSIEAFLENPSMLNNMILEPNISWMRTVTLDEAQNCKLRMSIWTKTDSKPKTSIMKDGSSFTARAFKPIQKWEAGLAGEPGLDFALTPMCGQYMWRDSFFPCCPVEAEANLIAAYYENIKAGAVFSYSESPQFSEKLMVLEAVKTNNNSSIVVLCEQVGEGRFSTAGIIVNERGFFIHFKLGTYGDKESAYAAFSSNQELTDFWALGYLNAYR